MVTPLSHGSGVVPHLARVIVVTITSPDTLPMSCEVKADVDQPRVEPRAITVPVATDKAPSRPHHMDDRRGHALGAAQESVGRFVR